MINEPSLPQPFLHAASDQKLDGTKLPTAITGQRKLITSTTVKPLQSHT